MCTDVVVRAEKSLQKSIEDDCKTFSVSNTSAPCIVPFMTSYSQEPLQRNFAFRKFSGFLCLSEI